MTSVKVNLMNITNNWDNPALKEFDFNFSDKGRLTKVNQFDIILQSTDTKEILAQKISLHLFDLLITDKKNWQNGKRCRFCFNDTVELDNEAAFIECSTCNRLYRYNKRLDSIPFPHHKYLYLHAGQSILYSNTSIFQHPLQFVKTFRYDQLNLFNNYFDQVADKIRVDDTLEISSLLHEKVTIDEVNCVLFYDFFELMQKTEVLQNIKEGYVKLFWRDVDYAEFNKKTKNSITRDSPNFIKDNNSFKLLSNEIQSRVNLTKEFEKLPIEVFDKLTKGFSSIVLKAYFDKDSFINLLHVFQTIQLDESVPYVSYFVDELDQLKHKIWRPLAGSDLQEKWQINILHKKSLRFKLKMNDMFFTFKLFHDNDVTITLPIISNTKFDKNILVTAVDIVNSLIRKIQRLPYQQNLSTDTIQEIDRNLMKWGTNQSNVVFASLNMNNVIEHKIVDIQRMGILTQCLKNYTIFDQVNDNKLTFFYVYDVEDKQTIRYEKFLREIILIRKNLFNNQIVNNLEVLENIRSDFSTFFNLDNAHSSFLFNKWIEDNKNVLGNIQDGIKNKRLRWHMLNGIFVTIEVSDDNLYKFRINGIKRWEQENEIIKFVSRLFYLTANLSKHKFFKNVCKIEGKGTNYVKTTNVNLKQALKKHLPDLFWDTSKIAEKGYARKCQKKEQPLIFSTEQGYRSWLAQQQPQNKTPLQKIFSRKCPSFTQEQMIARIKELGHIPIGDSRELCLQFQRVEFQSKDKLDREGNSWSITELKEITSSLNLPIINSREKLLRNIERYFTIEEFKIHENVEDVMPNPHTFIVNRDDNKFYITCPNSLNNSKSINSKFMGFLDIKDHPKANTVTGNKKRKFCVPCCKERINESRTDFCAGLVDYDDYLSGLTSQSTVDYIKNSNKFPLTHERYGHLHDKLFQLFNQHPKKSDKLLKKVNRLTLIHKAGIYLRIGVEQNNFSFINAVLSTLSPNNKMTLPSALRKMRNALTDDLFRNLNSGNLFWKYNGDINSYKNILDPNNLNEIDIQDIWDLMSRPKVLTSIGINVMIFEIQKTITGPREDETLHLVCPKDQEINHFFNLGRPTVFLYHGGNQQYEPIINYFSPTQMTTQFAFSQENLIAMADWYKETCALTGIDASMTAKSLAPKFKPTLQLVDQFNKVQYLLTTDAFLIPTIPSGFIMDIPRKSSKNVKIYMKDFDSTLEFLKQNNFDVKSVLVKDDSIKGIILANDRIVPVILEPYNGQLPQEDDDSILDIHAIDEAILTDLPKHSFSNVKKQIFREEAYQRFRLEFSYFIGSMNKSQINEAVLKKFMTTVKVTNDFDADAYERQNLRQLCKKAKSAHCDDDKLIVLQKDVKPFQLKLLNELDKFPSKAKEIYNKRVDVIINPLLFLNDQKHMFF